MKIIFALLILNFNFCLGFVVFIDPGHGGDEHGAIGTIGRSKIEEKSLSLVLARKIKEELKKDYKVFLSRSFDRDVDLDRRAQLADQVKADVFISVHFNSSNSNKSTGIETYYLDNHHNRAVKKVEALENGNLGTTDNMVTSILIDLAIQKSTRESKKLANLVHREVIGEVSKSYRMRNRGVRPGLFYVLARAMRPAILIEAGFVSNSLELRKISSEAYLDRYAQAVSRGVKNFLGQKVDPSLALF